MPYPFVQLHGVSGAFLVFRVGTARRQHLGSETSFPYIGGPPQTPKPPYIKKNAVNRASLFHPQNRRCRSEGAWGSGTIPAGAHAIFVAGWYLLYTGSVWQSASSQKKNIFEVSLAPAPPQTAPIWGNLGGQMRHMSPRRPNGNGAAFGVVFKSLLLSKDNQGQKFS